MIQKHVLPKQIAKYASASPLQPTVSVTLQPVAAHPKNSTRRQQGCANRLVMKPFKRNETIERFVLKDDAAFRHITLTACYCY